MMLPRPVMLTANLHEIGGTQTQCLRLSRAMAQLGSHPRILSPQVAHPDLARLAPSIPIERAYSRAAAGVRWCRDRLKPGTPVPCAPFDREAEAARAVPSGRGSLLFQRLPNLLDQERLLRHLLAHRSNFEILHLHGVYWMPLLRLARRAARRLDVPLVVKITNEPARTWELLRRVAGGVADLQGADAVITLSREAEAFFRAKLPSTRVVYLPNGVEIPESLARATPAKRDVVYVGWLKRQKGVDILLRAWKLLGERTERLLIVGDGDERVALEALVGSLSLAGRVQLLGRRDDVSHYLSGAQVFVLPSRWEGMPNALLEAMAHGLPCVATNVAGSSDLVADGVTGLLVQPEDPQALAGALARLLDSPEERTRLGMRAREVVLEGFSLPSIARKTLQLYEELLMTRALRSGARTSRP